MRNRFEKTSTTEVKNENNKIDLTKIIRPTNAFVGVSWTALIVGMSAFIVGLWNAQMYLSEKGYYFTLLMFGLFSVISVQKSVRDRLEGIKVTDIYYGISWFTSIMSIILLVIGLWNANITLSEKGFYGMAYTLSLFAVVAVQKNTRDNQMEIPECK